MTIQLNGKQEQVQAGLTVRGLVEAKGINPNAVACELNMEILKRAVLGEVVLKDGDVLEIIQMIGGG